MSKFVFKPFICWCGFNTINVSKAKAHCDHKHTVIFDDEDHKTGFFCLHCLGGVDE
jgi:hypothetical protein